jgi:hypothetical protein
MVQKVAVWAGAGIWYKKVQVQGLLGLRSKVGVGAWGWGWGWGVGDCHLVYRHHVHRAPRVLRTSCIGHLMYCTPGAAVRVALIATAKTTPGPSICSMAAAVVVDVLAVDGKIGAII